MATKELKSAGICEMLTVFQMNIFMCTVDDRNNMLQGTLYHLLVYIQ